MPLNEQWRRDVELWAGKVAVGECGFRLMPTDDFATGPAALRIELAAGGWASIVRYQWTHPEDGEQDGALFIASLEEDGSLQATLVDSWHQKPGPMHLTGTRENSVTKLYGTYMETWGWEIELRLVESDVRLIMRNVVPEEARDMAPEGVEFASGAYDVMDFCGR